MDKYNPIGIFDSGVGGLSVLKKIVSLLPNENYIYFGDTARIPYGEKTKEELLTFSREILDWFSKKNVKAVLIACNTSSAVTLDVVKQEYDFPILGLIQPTANYISTLEFNKIGLMATSATVKSQAYSKAIKKLDIQKEVFEIACPGLVEIIESGEIGSEKAKVSVNNYIQKLLANNVDKIILGCTHYPYLKDIINEITKNPDMLIDPADFLINATKNELEKNNILNDSSNSSVKYFVSSNPEKFVKVGSNFFPKCKNVKKIDLYNCTEKFKK